MSKTAKIFIGFIASIATYTIVVGNDTSDCARTIYASDVSRWIDETGGPVDYRDGKWYDQTDKLIGTSATEDSDICAK